MKLLSEFEIGETYRNSNNKDFDVFVTAIFSQSLTDIHLVILKVDPQTGKAGEAGEAIVKRSDLKDWTLVQR